MKIKIVSLGLVFSLTALLVVGCGKESVANNSIQNMKESSSTVATSTKGENSNQGDRSNHDKLLELLKAVKQKTGGMVGSGELGTFLGNFDLMYKQDIANPYNKSTDIYAPDKYEDELYKKKETNKSDYSANVVAIVHADLKDIDKAKVNYGCNPKNKGVVMAFVFVDGIYMYDVDENGNKINETTFTYEVGK